MSTPAAKLPAGRPAVLYLRRSTDRQEQSIGDQRAHLLRFAAERGFEVVGEYADDAISGTSMNGRDEFARMLADARASDRLWRYILVFDVSRFSRGDLDEAGHLRYELRKAGIEVVYCSENFAGSDSDELVLGVKQWQARQFVKDLSRVTIRGQVSHSASGAWCGGTPPFGYDLLYHDSSGKPCQRVRWLESGEKEVYDAKGRLQRVLPRGDRLTGSKQDRAQLVRSSPERVAVIVRIFREYTEGGRGLRTIADGLNRDGIPSPRDGNWSSNALAKWSVGTIRAIVRNPGYRGDLAWNRRTFAKFHRVAGRSAVERPRLDADRVRENPASDWIVVSGTHEALVPPSRFDRAQELMRARARNASGPSFRVGSGLRSPYLLTSLLTCGRCGHAYQGRTVNSRKHRRDGSKIQTLYYACGGFIMKGSSVCEKLLLRKDPLEGVLLDLIRQRLHGLLNGEGEALLREFIEEELGAQGQDPRREVGVVRTRIAEIDRKADVLLEGLSPETRGFIDGKLRELAAEKDRLQRRLEELDALPYQPIDADAVLAHGKAFLNNLPRLLEAGSLEERKEFVRAFIAGVTVLPDEGRLEVQIQKLPTGVFPQPGVVSVGVVAGAGFEPATFGL